MPLPETHPSDPQASGNRFVYLFAALVALLVLYPYLHKAGTYAGAFVSLVLLIAGVYAVRTSSCIFAGAVALAIAAASTSLYGLSTGSKGLPIVEGAFTLFYAYLTLSIFPQVFRNRQVTANTIWGAVSVYLLLGVTFGTLYDLIETLAPGSFLVNTPTEPPLSIGWRQLIFYSFMTLTTIGYGDITPATFQTQSLAIVEGVIGVLYVAILIARTIGIYSAGGGFDKQGEHS